MAAISAAQSRHCWQTCTGRHRHVGAGAHWTIIFCCPWCCAPLDWMDRSRQRKPHFPLIEDGEDPSRLIDLQAAAKQAHDGRHGRLVLSVLRHRNAPPVQRREDRDGRRHIPRPHAATKERVGSAEIRFRLRGTSEVSLFTPICACPLLLCLLPLFPFAFERILIDTGIGILAVDEALSVEDNGVPAASGLKTLGGLSQPLCLALNRA